MNMLLICFGFGIWAAAAIVPPFSYVFGVSLVLSIFVGIAVWRESRYSWLWLSGLFLVLGIMRFLAVYELPATDISHWAGKDVEIQGVVLETAKISEDKRGKRVTYLIETDSVQASENGRKSSGRAYVYTRPVDAVPVAEIGDRITVRGKVSEIHGYENPGRVDTRLAMRIKGITARIVAGKSSVKVEKADDFNWRKTIESVRNYYRSLMTAVMPEEDAAAIFAMLFGGYEGIKPELVESFTITGIVHILSVSGSHITLLAATLAFLGKWLCWGRWLTIGTTAGAVFGYCLLSGGVSPAVRAGIMGLLAFWGQMSGYERDARRLLSLTASGMLIISPLLLFDISFQLSFAATAGLLYLLPAIQKKLMFLSEKLASGLALTLSAQLAVLPIIAWYFNSISLSSLCANIIVVPIVEFMIIIGLAAGLIGWVLPFGGKVVFLLDSLLLGLVYEMTRLIAGLPLATVYLPTIGTGLASVYYLFIGLILQTAEIKERLWVGIKKCSIWIAVSLFVIVITYGTYHLSRPAELMVHFIDVGQGDAALVITPHGKAVLIDSGGTIDNVYDVGERVVVPYLLHYGVTELETIYLTHAHADHAGGAGSIAKRLPVKVIIVGNESRESYAKSMRVAYADETFKKIVAASEGQVREIDGVKFEILYAPHVAADANEYSNVIRVNYGRASFLFTGDLPAEKEKNLLAIADPESTVLKVAHHGAKTSTSIQFLQETAPRWAVISVGAGNTFGHPAQETLAKLVQAGTKTYRTDKDGAIVFRTDGEKMWTETYVSRKLKAFCR